MTAPLDPTPQVNRCNDEMYPGGIRCAREKDHEGKHNNVGEIIQWSAPLCWSSLMVGGRPHVCIKELGHHGPHGEGDSCG
jgi:hypothetical protein